MFLKKKIHFYLIFLFLYSCLNNNLESVESLSQLIIKDSLNAELYYKRGLSFYNNKRPVKTASDYQSRNKIYSSSIGSWKNFDKFLAKSFVNLET